MRTTFKTILYGIIARTINPFIKAKPKHWVFASNYGKTWGEGSRNLMLYVLEHDKSIKCTYITQNYNVYKELKSQNIPCELNWSLKGVLSITKADCVFFTHGGTDIDFAYKKSNRRFYYLTHGQAFKVALNCLLKDKDFFHQSLYRKLRIHFADFIYGSVLYNNSDFVSCCSDFIYQFTRKEFDDNVKIKVLGSPRNDILFTPEKLKNEFLETLKNKFVISYMPTHRKYGKGEVPPYLFTDNKEYQDWLNQNNIVILIKQHPNMISQINSKVGNDVIIDITRMNIDPQSVLVYSDALITDYSSVWMDYLLLKRPLLFYLYDDFEKDDVGFYYKLEDNPPGIICKTEETLFMSIQECKLHYDDCKPKLDVIAKYHKYIDGDSCRRHYEEIIKRCQCFEKQNV